MIHEKKPVILIIGTRPEGIKMAPVYFALKRAKIPTIVCCTMQHNQLLKEVLDLFGIVPDIELNIMRPGQDLFYVTQSVLQKTKDIFSDINPSLVLVQGDTTSSMSAALAAFYLNIPIGHVEAGLRTDDIHAPFPEEMNRRVIGVISTYHFAPTPAAVGNILAHGVQRNRVFYTGNTVVDALRIITRNIKNNDLIIRDDIIQRIKKCKKDTQKILLLTVHRRESFNGGIENILTAVKTFLQNNTNAFCFFTVHPNPNVIHAVRSVGLSALPNIYVSEPVTYKDMVYLLNAADIVLTDSGGIQEEAVSLAKPVLVLREKTERMEGVLAGLARVVGTNTEKIITALNMAAHHRTIDFAQSVHTYGDGYAADKIVGIIQAHVKHNKQIEKTARKVTVTHVNKKKEATMKKVVVVGLGYIGLPTAIVLADHGIKVVGFDIDQKRVDRINNGDPVIQEPTVYEKLQLTLGAETFCATTKIEAADFFIIAVPTPITADKKADLHYVFDAVSTIAHVLKKGDTVIVESTISVGTTDRIAQILAEKTNLIAGNDFFVAHCPERVLPGRIIKELVENDRIIGGINKESVQQAKKLYALFVRGTIYSTNAKTAEVVKLIENSSRDVQLAFANQVDAIAQKAELNPYEVIELANKHPRVNILRPTTGVGGHCIAIDPWFLIETFEKETTLLKTARIINDEKPETVIRCIKQAAKKWCKKNEAKKCTVALLGLTYKPNVDDLRESPALRVAQELLKNNDNIEIVVVEPHIPEKKLLDLFGNNGTTITEGINKADIVAFLVNHERFSVIDHSILQKKYLLDFCGVLHKQKITIDSHAFWPARSMMDFFIVNQGESLQHATQKMEQEQ